MFIDNVKIYLRAGSGGRGCRSFYRDKYQRRGIPDGGDGGKGADVIARVNRNLLTLLDFQYKRHLSGANGAHGSGKNKKGKDAAGLIFELPAGTVIRDARTGCVLGDLVNDGQELIVAKGGKGGLGNRHKQEPTEGEPGEERELVLDLELIADCGLIGFPNAGKSTLICALTQAKSKIAAYPFTTKAPVLGVVDVDEKRFVIADIPGLIEGSAKGKGLGDRFLRHVERTRVLVHVLDISGFEGRDPLKDYFTLISELKQYSRELAKKKQIVAANKMDIPSAEANLSRLKQKVRKKIFPISALKKEGLEDLVDALRKEL